MYIFQLCFKMNNIFFLYFHYVIKWKKIIFSQVWRLPCHLPLAYRETNLLLSSPRLCFLRNWISELENENCFTTEIFQNLVCLKPWNCPLGGMSHLHSWNPPWVPSNLPFPHYMFLLLTIFTHPIVFSSLSTFYWSLLQACDSSLHLGNNYIFCILLIYLYYLVLNRRHVSVSCPNISTFAALQYPTILEKTTFPCC
jgi:hypothetical protein